jgi:hypothetical protein
LKRKDLVKKLCCAKKLLPEHTWHARLSRSRVTPRTQTRGQLYEREAREERA